MENKIEIIICLGSSCFSRGNGKTLGIIKKYLEENNLSKKVFFHGDLCTGNCDKGPVLKIGKNFYHNVAPDKVLDILKENFEF